MSAQGKRELELRFPARADQLSPMREALRESVQGCGCDGEATADIVMAVDEACQNIIRHAYGGRPGGEIVLEVDRERDGRFSGRLDARHPFVRAGVIGTVSQSATAPNVAKILSLIVSCRSWTQTPRGKRPAEE